ncbi:hypothetical protein ACFXO9_28795 [Nocardia tengchongensis]|uniref:hypothetical protein n=1 Tax=Nocardia tengchongensis TaxID=2055889 RepID=UPI003697102D
MTDELGGFEGAPERTRRLVYIAVAVVLAAVAVAGLAAPDPTTIADSLGADGGLVCQDPSSPLIKARYRASISNGATGPGSRPVIADDDVLKATALAIATYCPDELASYLKNVGDLKTGDTVDPDDHN